MFIRLLQAAVVALAVAVLGRLAATLHPLLDLFSHAALHVAASALVVGGLLALAGRRAWALAALGLAVAALAPSHGLLQAPAAGEGAHDDLTVVQFNARHSNRQVGDFVAALLRDPARRPEIVVVQEVSPLVLLQLGALDAAYPNGVLRAEYSAYGVAIFTSLHLADDETLRMPGAANHAVRLRLRLPRSGRQLTLIETHAVWPLGTQVAARRNAELAFVAGLAAQSAGEPVVLVGDLNVTPYSPHFRALERAAGLTSNLRGRWPVGTWPGWMPAWAAIPIDHLLVSPQVQVLERRVGPSFGSDHYAVTTRLRVFDQPAAAR